MKKLPPIEKVYEAWSAIADGRVSIIDPGRATVRSSDGSKSYSVLYDNDSCTYSSDDNASLWQRYPGYPVLAVMMLTGKLPCNSGFISHWAGVNWTETNKRFRRDYAAAAAAVAAERGIDISAAATQAAETMAVLEAMDYQLRRAPRNTV